MEQLIRKVGADSIKTKTRPRYGVGMLNNNYDLVATPEIYTARAIGTFAQ
jgi:hypothetical protein